MAQSARGQAVRRDASVHMIKIQGEIAKYFCDWDIKGRGIVGSWAKYLQEFWRSFFEIFAGTDAGYSKSVRDQIPVPFFLLRSLVNLSGGCFKLGAGKEWGFWAIALFCVIRQKQLGLKNGLCKSRKLRQRGLQFPAFESNWHWGW